MTRGYDEPNHGFEHIWSNPSCLITDLSTPIMSQTNRLFYICMLEDTYEVTCDIVHRPARLDVIGVGGRTEATKIGCNEVILILHMCYSVGARG